MESDPSEQRRARALRWLAPAVALCTLVVGFAFGRVSAPSPEELRAARNEAAVGRDRIARLEHERARLRTERDQLEGRLAAGSAPAVCPEESVSTGTAVPGFSIDYPCGWHVVNREEKTSADASSDGEGGMTAGLTINITLLSRLPISLVPKTGPFAEIELALWRDDPDDDEDRLQPVGAWLERERAGFERITRQDSFEAGAGTTVHRLTGVLKGDDLAQATVLLWEVSGPPRAVARAFALAPNRTVLAALDRVARSFRAAAR